jgi:hypothetical protein
MHKRSAVTTPASRAIAGLTPLVRLVSINRKKTGPIKIILRNNPSKIADVIREIIKYF